MAAAMVIVIKFPNIIPIVMLTIFVPKASVRYIMPVSGIAAKTSGRERV